MLPFAKSGPQFRPSYLLTDLIYPSEIHSCTSASHSFVGHLDNSLRGTSIIARLSTKLT